MTAVGQSARASWSLLGSTCPALAQAVLWDTLALLSSLVVLVVKNLHANAGGIKDMGLIRELGRSLEEGVATHSNILAWRIP